MAKIQSKIADPSTGGVIQPPVDTSTADQVNIVSRGVSGFVSAFAGNQKAKIKADASAREGAVLDSFSREMGKFGKAIEQHPEKSAMIIARAKSLKNATIAAHGQYSKDLNGIANNLLKDTALGDAFEQEDVDTANRNQVVKDYLKSGGTLLDGESEDEVNTALDVFQRKRATSTKLAQDHARLNFIETKKDAKNKTEERTLTKTIRRDTEEFARDEYTDFDRFATQTVQLFTTGVDDASTTMNKLLTKMADYEEDAVQLTRGDSGLANALLQPFKSRIKAVEELMKGELTAASFKNKREAIVNKIALQLVQDSPTLAERAALGLILDNPNLNAFWADADNEMINLITKYRKEGRGTVLRELGGASPTEETDAPIVPIDIAQGEPSEKKALDVVVADINSWDKLEGDNKEIAIKEGSARITSYLKGINGYSNLRKTPKEYREFVKFTANPAFLKARNKGLVDEDDMNTADEVLADRYETLVVKTIQQDLAGKDLQVGWGTGGLAITVRGEAPIAAGVKSNLFPTGPQRMRITSDRFPDHERALMEIIRRGAHMEVGKGHTNYKKIFEDNKHIFFPGLFEDPLVVPSVEEQAAMDQKLADEDAAKVALPAETAVDIMIRRVKDLKEIDPTMTSEEAREIIDRIMETN